MRSILLPPLKFSNWYEWDNRNNYPLAGNPGVYLISITSDGSLAGEKPNFKDVVYIGMTVAQLGLRGRWNQFYRAITGGKKHSGGKRVFADKGNYNTWSDNLYVAGMGVECDIFNPTDEDYIKMGWVTYLEYEAFAHFYKYVGGHPRYNFR